jgi:Na+/melibiose symporter-like transporter
VGQLNAAGYRTYGIVAAVVMFVAIIVSSLGTHRFIPHFRAPEKRRLSLAEYAKEMLASLNNRAFLILMIASLFLNFATGLVFALNFYISTFFWMLNSSGLGVLALAIFISVLLAFFIAPPISKKFGKKRGAIGMFMVGFVIANTPITLGLLGIIGPQTPDLISILFAFSVVSAALTIGCSILIVAMIADVVEDSELKTGRRSEGLFFAGNSLLQKAVTGLGVFGSGILLRLTDFPTNAQPGHVDPGIVHHFSLVYVLANGFFYILGFIILAYFPIDRKSHADNLSQLAAETAQAGESADMGVEP